MESPLRDKKVYLKPVKRKGSWIAQLTNNENHDGAHMYSGSTLTMRGVPYDVRTRKRVDVLTKDEQDFFESPSSGLGLSEGDLSIYLEKDNYWDRFQVKLEGSGLALNLNDPMDYMRYKFLLAQKDNIAPSWEERFDKGTFKYAIVDDDVVVKERVEKRNKVNEANRFFGRIEDSPERMIDFLNIYYAGKKVVNENSKRSLLVASIDEIIENDLKGFLKVSTDTKYDIKAFINRCIRKTLIVKEKSGEYYIQGEEDKFTLSELIDFLSDKKHQSIYGKLKAQMDN